MQTQQRVTRCPVYLHPAAATNPAVIATIQHATGQLIVLVGGRPQLKQQHARYDGFSPFGGAA
jgi:hypothetical protein